VAFFPTTPFMGKHHINPKQKKVYERLKNCCLLEEAVLRKNDTYMQLVSWIKSWNRKGDFGNNQNPSKGCGLFS
jgi:hypothetical protein